MCQRAWRSSPTPPCRWQRLPRHASASTSLLPNNGRAVAELTYPADPAETALALFVRWFGSHFARSTALAEFTSAGGVLQATLSVGRRWSVHVSILNTLAAEATLPYEASRAAIERRLDQEGRAI